jgi:hypothetical protein
MLIGSIRKHKSITGFIEKKLVDPQTCFERHSELVLEMLNRGYNHNSPPELIFTNLKADIDSEENLVELARRCPECRSRIEGHPIV